jgi:Flp pilus assembly protein TadG
MDMDKVEMKRTRRGCRRRGVVMVEFAIVVPVLFVLFFASFEFCRVAMIRHTADNAVYEGCRVGIIPGATAEEMRAEVARIMDSLGVKQLDIEVSPTTIQKQTTHVKVRITVPLDDNSYVPNQFVAGRSIVRELSMQREGVR